MTMIDRPVRPGESRDVYPTVGALGQEETAAVHEAVQSFP
jgi:hypothetical protein